MEEPRIDKTVYTGRPENTEGRLEKEIAVYDFLDSFGIEYKRADHEALMTMEACEAVDQILGAQICKNLFLCNRQKTDFYLLLMPGEKPFKTKFLSKQIGTARLSFADGEQMEEYLNITPGSLSLMGLIFDKEKKVHLVIDKEVLDEEYFGCHPVGSGGAVLAVSARREDGGRDLRRHSQARSGRLCRGFAHSGQFGACVPLGIYRNYGYAPVLPLGRERIFPQQKALPPQGRARAVYGYRSGTRRLFQHRTGPH